MTPEERKVYNKEYREKNKEKIKEYQKVYKKEYRQTEVGIKSNRIGKWKHTGVKSDDFNSLYEHYLDCDKCEECFINLTTGKISATSKCLDHSHETGEFRNVVCFNCNIKRGR
tara:strand:+ start:213 stop:551 length:339 start_codon:yes stop_codon:yes gene_type:complete